MQDPAFVRYLERIGEERLTTFSTYDFLALHALRTEQPLEPELRSALPRLAEYGAVEKMGRGRGVRHLLSRELYAALGATGSYTRQRGLDHETNKALLERHLTDAKDAGAPIGELMQVLPMISRAHIKRLLEELRGEGRVHLLGRTRGGRWFAGEAPGAAGLTQSASAPAE